MGKSAWFFSGQGTQYYQMGHSLYNSKKEFKLILNNCETITKSINKKGFIEEIYKKENTKGKIFNDIRYTNPALFSIQYSLAKFLLEEGVQPDCITGFSLGEIVALTLTEQLTLEEGLHIVTSIAEILHEYCPKGRMIAILDRTTLIKLHQDLFEGLDLASINYENNFIVSGNVDRINILQKKLFSLGIICEILPVEYAFHSPKIDIIKEKLLERIGNVPTGQHKYKTYSTSKQSFVTSMNKEDIWNIIRGFFDFKETVTNIEEFGYSDFLDLSPSGTAANLIKRNLHRKNTSNTYVFMSLYDNNTLKLEEYLASHKN